MDPRKASVPAPRIPLQASLATAALLAAFPALALLRDDVAAASEAAASGSATRLVEVERIEFSPRDVVEPVAVAAASFGRLYLADLGRGAVVSLGDGGRADFEFEPPPGQVGLQPLDVAVTGFQVYVLDAQANALLRFTDDGAYLDVLQSFRGQDLETPRSVAVDAAGRVLLAQPAQHLVRLVDETQRAETLVGGFGKRPGEMSRPAGVAFGARGAFYVADTGNRRIQRFSGVGNFEAALVDSLVEPRGLAVGQQGELFVADPGRRAVHLFGPTGAHRHSLAVGRGTPIDVSASLDTLWVLVVEPHALLRVRVVREK